MANKAHTFSLSVFGSFIRNPPIRRCVYIFEDMYHRVYEIAQNKYLKKVVQTLTGYITVC